MKSVFTTGEAAKICRVSIHVITRCIDSGLLKGYVVPGGSHRRVSRAALVEFMEKHELPIDHPELSGSAAEKF